jgi:hypothetical protein
MENILKNEEYIFNKWQLYNVHLKVGSMSLKTKSWKHFLSLSSCDLGGILCFPGPITLGLTVMETSRFLIIKKGNTFYQET